MYKSVKIVKGPNGWGGPLIITPTEKKNKIVSITGKTIHPLAHKLAELTGCEIVNGFVTGVPEDEIMVVIVDCGGTARCGVYPKKRIFTINVMPVGQAGPLAQYITSDIYVSDVKENNVTLAEEGETVAAAAEADSMEGMTNKQKGEALKKEAREKLADTKYEKEGFLTRLGKATGGVIAIFYQSGREVIETVIKNILPFMAFTSMLIGIILGTGIGDFIANKLAPLAGNMIGLLVISIICAIPVFSPLLGPGAVIAQVVGVLVGTQIGLGSIPASLALPALFAIDPQVGCDFIPVGLSLGDAEAETIEIGVPAILFSRLITGPVSVALAYVASIGLF
ncbi:PTS glucitol/sorbitol transporter subunit IIB [Sebaldella sp. S0638]|uniref:PTS glucitol/sorbitol transporter subunit IIB n=1 Tax=Sebaldella sp. S0638 TaxID=2957809 RepID=UPI00209F218F|nr:PTS glucitol/sorbitol transporter subunit IIB [Sebaldella sp. S0638]MCP1224883.1 PTS glucitol/sorbitol transporter subunit IIB [Sebaldella sp. S0638]